MFRLTMLVLLISMLACSPTPTEAPATASVSESESVTGPAVPKGSSPETTGASEGAPEAPASTHSDPSRVNRLAKETSPYLLMHAHNPVDWYPWGEEALTRAKKEGKPIFLSIGYSSCHWCHVMEKESFMDEEIARILNEHFVCIKVDREERPDVDAIYMLAVQTFSQGHGGWPMSVFLTPDAEPFFGGTYFPARDGDRGPNTRGFLTLARQIQELWKSKRDLLVQDGKKVASIIKSQWSAPTPAALAPIGAQVPNDLQAALRNQFDPQFGGFGYDPTNPQRPKFPEPSNLLFLVARQKSARTAKPAIEVARQLMEDTLQTMAMGGIRDHLGGGFHRYSVDRFWRIPHFEKMLYDNGQLATIYSEAFELTGRSEFRRVVEELVEFVRRDMTDANGGFYSALDADSEGEEGKYYRWEKAQVETLLTPDEFRQFASVYGMDDKPNFEQHFYVPQFNQPWAKLALALEKDADKLEEELAPIRRKLLAAREQRIRPLTDTKIITSWNGLMIRGMADAGRILKRPQTIEAAARAAQFLLTHLRTAEGRLQRTYRSGSAKLNGYLDDYAFLANGLIALHQATGDASWLHEANQLTTKQIELFWDDDGGGFFFTSHDHESLIARAKDPHDGALPSGNSVAVENLIYLARALDNPAYLDQAEEAILFASITLQRLPAAAPRMVAAVDAYLEARGSQ